VALTYIVNRRWSIRTGNAHRWIDHTLLIAVAMNVQARMKIEVANYLKSRQALRQDHGVLPGVSGQNCLGLAHMMEPILFATSRVHLQLASTTSTFLEVSNHDTFARRKTHIFLVIPSKWPPTQTSSPLAGSWSRSAEWSTFEADHSRASSQPLSR